MQALPHSVPPTLLQANADPRLRWRLLDTHKHIWVSFLWCHCSFLLGPGAHKVLSVPCKSLFPQSCGSSAIKSHWPSKSNSLGVLSPFARSPGWEIWCGSQNFRNSAKTSLVLTVLRLVGCLLGGSVVGLTPDTSQVCCSQSPWPCSRPLLTCASTGDTQTLKGKSGSVAVGSLGPAVHKVLFEPSKTMLHSI